MKFGTFQVEEAESTILAHAVQAGGSRMRKGQRLSPADIAMLREAGIGEVVAVRLDAGDVEEDQAATRVAAALVFAGAEARKAATGRVNIHASASGLFRVSRSVIDRLNAIDPAITIATLADFAPVEAGAMVATIKIIPFAVAGDAVDAAERSAAREEAFRVHAWKPQRVGLVQSTLPGVKASVLDKTARITAERLARSGSSIAIELRPAHVESDVADALEKVLAGSDIGLVFGASALCDFDDVIPAAIRRLGGSVERAGMPVDPGNLLVLGSVGDRLVLGAPGCARSPKENGFDWVLDRIMAGLPVGAGDIALMGVGGLLMEIPTRPKPRDTARHPSAKPTVAAIVLAAGRSSRMGGPNKLLAEFDGVPLVRRTVERVLEAGPVDAIVVTGHQAERVQSALEALPVRCVHNPDYAEGLSASLKTGIAALPPAMSGALVGLADMPGVTAGDYRRLVTAFLDAGGTAIVRATHAGKRGNPVVLPASMFSAIARIDGDAGARHLMESGEWEVVDVELGPAASQDVDTPAAMSRAGGVLTG